MKLTQLTPVRCHRASLLDGVYVYQPMEKVLNPSGRTFLQGLKRVEGSDRTVPMRGQISSTQMLRGAGLTL